MNTKQRILKEALHLFSQKGYEAVSVEQIADAVGIKAPSLYKHYKGKQDIFHAIFEETTNRYSEFTDQIIVHMQDTDQELQVFEELTEDVLATKVRKLFTYSLHDEFVSQFRRMMTIEQFRSPELAELYTKRYVDEMNGYHTELFRKIISVGGMKNEDPELLAMMYDAPIITLIGVCDRQPEKEQECLKKLEEHVRLFYRAFHME